MRKVHLICATLFKWPPSSPIVRNAVPSQIGDPVHRIRNRSLLATISFSTGEKLVIAKRQLASADLIRRYKLSLLVFESSPTGLRIASLPKSGLRSFFNAKSLQRQYNANCQLASNHYVRRLAAEISRRCIQRPPTQFNGDSRLIAVKEATFDSSPFNAHPFNGKFFKKFRNYFVRSGIILTYLVSFLVLINDSGFWSQTFDRKSGRKITTIFFNAFSVQKCMRSVNGVSSTAIKSEATHFVPQNTT